RERNSDLRRADRFGIGAFAPASSSRLDPRSRPLGLHAPQLALAARTQRHVRALLIWARMPIVIRIDGRVYLSDQRFYGPLHSHSIPAGLRRWFSRHSFLVPLDKAPTSS